MFNKTQQPKTHFFLFVALWLLGALMMQPLALATGRVEHHVITSKVLADAGLPATKEMSVYLPEEYDTSGLVYPVLYLLHGSTPGTNRTFLGAGYAGVMSDVRVDTIMDKLLANGSIRPFIVVLPTYHGDFPSGNPLHYDYIAREVIPFVESTYRTRPQREARAISGHSRGGYISIRFAFLYPDRVSLVGSYAGGFTLGLDPINAHPQQRYPLRFWLYSGTNDTTVNPRDTSEFAKNLQNAGLPVVYVEDDGDHFNRIAQRLEESLVFFSEHLGGGVTAVQPRGKLATRWGEMKRGR